MTRFSLDVHRYGSLIVSIFNSQKIAIHNLANEIGEFSKRDRFENAFEPYKFLASEYRELGHSLAILAVNVDANIREVKWGSIGAEEDSIISGKDWIWHQEIERETGESRPIQAGWRGSYHGKN